MSVNLATQYFKVSYIVQSGFYTPATITTLSYPLDWVFDSSTFLSLCAHEDGGYSIGCIVQNVKWTSIRPDSPALMPFTNNGTFSSRRILY